MLFSLLSFGRVTKEYSKVSKEEYINRFNHEGIRDFMRDTISGGILALFFTMGIFARGDGGFSEGGSITFCKTY